MKQCTFLHDPKTFFVLLLTTLSCHVKPTVADDGGGEGMSQQFVDPTPVTVNPRLEVIDEKYSKCRGVDIRELSVFDIQKLYDSNKLTSADLTKCYLERLDRMNTVLRVVIESNPAALKDARKLDIERILLGKRRNPLHGIPVLLKESIGTVDMTETTCGSPALVGLRPKKEAPVVTTLKKAGAIILGKTNIPEFYGVRGTNIPEAWSGRGGLTRNAYNLSVAPAGSSAGSAVGVSANLAPVAVGTETDASIIAPSNVNGIVGMKPTLGLASVAGIIPLSFTQDTVGPMAKTVMDTAILLDGMVSKAERPKHHPPSYASHLLKNSKPTKPLRVGVLRYPFWDTSVLNSPNLRHELPQLEKALDAMRKSSEIEVVDPVETTVSKISTTNMFTVWFHEWKYTLNEYLKNDVVNVYPNRRAPKIPESLSIETPESYMSQIAPTRRITTMADIIKYNEEHPTSEGYNQDYFYKAQATDGITNKTYIELRDTNKALAKQFLDSVFDKYNLDAIVTPSEYRNDGVLKKELTDFPVFGFTVACIAGYPIISIPAGIGLREVPFGIMFTGRALSEHTLLQVAKAAEQTLPQRTTPKFLI